jgi:hypothetical protein
MAINKIKFNRIGEDMAYCHKFAGIRKMCYNLSDILRNWEN